MISFFRRIFSSKIGLFFTMGFVALIAVAFASSDVSGSGAFGGVTGSGTAATVGNAKLSTSELNQSVNNAFRAEQRENTALDIKTYVEGGGFESVLERLINSFSISAFGDKYGMTAGKRLVDAEIASIQAFQGADGQFSEAAFRAALQSQGIKEKQLRDDFTRNLMADQLLPLAGYAAAVPSKLVVPYASLLLEGRQGKVAIIPSTAFVTKVKPADAALKAFYSKNSSRYTIPERRSISYAIFDKSRFNDKIKPTDKEIEGQYSLDKVKYAATETRNLEQVILPTEEAANALAAKVTGGTTISAAAQSVGLSAAEIGSVTKNDLSKSASQSVANAVFAAKVGSVSAAAQSALGWHIVKINGVEQVKGKTLAEARPEIVSQLTQKKIDEAMADLTVRMEDEFSGGASMADIAKAEELKIESTPMLLANGQNPEDPNYRPIPEMQRILPAAFAMEQDSDPQLVEIVPGQQYAIVGVEEIIPAAPPSLKKIEQIVMRDYILDQGSKKAKVIADKISKAVSSGTALSKALADAKVKLPPVQTVKTTRTELAQLGQQGQKVPPPISLMFSMAEGSAKTLQAPGAQGWFVVSLEKIDRGDASKREDLIAATNQQFQQVFGNEYTEQFINAMKADIGVERNADALDNLKKQLSGVNSNY